MNLDDLEEALAEILPSGFQIETDNHGQIVIYTGLTRDDDGSGDLVDFEGEEDDEDPDFDPDFEPIEEEDEDDE